MTAGDLHWISLGETIRENEPRHEADEPGEFISGVPIARNFPRVFESEHGIEDGLMRESRRPRAKTGRGHQLELAESCRSIEDHGSNPNVDLGNAVQRHDAERSL